MTDYRHCYTVLGLGPDSDWETLRAHYRRLMGEWHPDRFSANFAQLKIAEERSKQITVAYQLLEKYHREHGTLPVFWDVASTAIVQGPERDAQVEPDCSAPGGRSEIGTSRASVRGSARHGRARQRRIAFAILAAAGAFYLAHNFVADWAANDSTRESGGGEPGGEPPVPRMAAPPERQDGISIGSTFGDVYAIQGIPTLTQGDSWYYGTSRIEFASGRVTHWIESPDNPLRIARSHGEHSRGENFKVGSTKEVVRAIQGAPVTETATVWDYGPSRVYFEGNRVIRWEESAMQPLRVKR